MLFVDKFKPNKLKVMLTLAIPFAAGLVISLAEGAVADKPNYVLYFPLGVFKTSCGYVKPGFDCDIGLEPISFLINIVIIGLLYTALSFLSVGKKIK
jgi:hypothetical protein